MIFYDCKGIMITKIGQYSILGKCHCVGFITTFRYFYTFRRYQYIKIPTYYDCKSHFFFVILHVLYKIGIYIIYIRYRIII